MTQAKLAEKIEVKPSLLNEVIKGKRAVNTELALLIEAAIHIPADMLLKLYNITEKEWVLNGSTVYILPLLELKNRFIHINYKEDKYSGGDNRPSDRPSDQALAGMKF